MNVILIYLHLAVIFGVGAMFVAIESNWAKAFGLLNVTFATIYAYFYAIYQLWLIFSN